MRNIYTLLISTVLTTMFSQSPLTGVWVRTAAPYDTLKFLPTTKGATSGLVNLTFEKGTKPPQNPEGIYDYKLFKDSMEIFWIAGSTLFPNQKKKYFLDNKYNTLTIENFYMPQKWMKFVTFKKIK